MRAWSLDITKFPEHSRVATEVFRKMQITTTCRYPGCCLHASLPRFDVLLACNVLKQEMSRLGGFGGLGSYYGLSDALLQQPSQSQRYESSDYDDRDSRLREIDQRRSEYDRSDSTDDYSQYRDFSSRRSTSRSDRYSPKVSFSSTLSDRASIFSYRFLDIPFARWPFCFQDLVQLTTCTAWNYRNAYVH